MKRALDLNWIEGPFATSLPCFCIRQDISISAVSYPKAMSDISSILSAIGNTPVVELRHIVTQSGARVLVKLENQNPTGSMKDRMAHAALNSAGARGELGPEVEVVEYTGGSTGTSLAFVCAAMGLKITLVTSDAFSREKRDQMRVWCPSHRTCQ